MIPRQNLCAILAVAMLSACAAAPAKRDPRDPFERVNRTTYRFNDAVDRAVAKPVAKAYRRVTPRFVRTGVSNLFANASYPTVFVNDLLQGKMRLFVHDTGRFLLNTTVGIGGLFDPATPAGLEANDEDFGQTFGKWGVGPGPYLVLPFIGPSTMRDVVGRVPEEFTTADHYIDDTGWRWGARGLRLLDRRSRLLDTENVLNRTYDPYAFLRNAYLQRREYLVRDGDVPEEPVTEEFDDAPVDETADEAAVQDEPATTPQTP